VVITSPDEHWRKSPNPEDSTPSSVSALRDRRVRSTSTNTSLVAERVKDQTKEHGARHDNDQGQVFDNAKSDPLANS